MEWISVENELPKLYQVVLAYVRHKCDKKFKVDLVVKTKNGWDSVGFGEVAEVSFWAEVPEPPINNVV